ncbi:hypothetical protein LHFGNBLO_004338 [Mesorhizobium sp. AR10]|uniref:hypothetical protein n=1 Tax=Mesorhizobium sp. AR10 TaxID=2865839 RepID=UPI0021607433|nr:hypothetical protein [Mesorhizobium sp. AR10]UVK37323.1 hypothetical protein LHFGNBLO_004338 [Mesorhizobium sp. AR10]
MGRFKIFWPIGRARRRPSPACRELLLKYRWSCRFQVAKNEPRCLFADVRYRMLVSPCPHGKAHRESWLWLRLQASLPGKSACLGLLVHDLLVVMMVVVMMADVVPVVMMMAVMLHMQRCCIGAACADDRHRDSQGNSKPEGGQEGLLHDIVSFSARFENHRIVPVT